MAENKRKFKVINIEANSVEDAMKQLKDELGLVEKRGPIRTPFGVTSQAECSCGCGRALSEVIKTIPATALEVKTNEAITKRAHSLEEERKKIEADKEKWWAEVRLRLPDGFTHNRFHYNQDTGQIEYLEEEK